MRTVESKLERMQGSWEGFLAVQRAAGGGADGRKAGGWWGKH